ncbi:hypothetical protein COZ39_00110 [Candidatus Roizmanbacteria bacterium CG_4_10_14_3_um_filter_33_21]|uniref:Uncharacterized protein n=1 Tax=Candidatus Roizmanbacteria bacterium CG_4_10_14_3_um_filter_33_21 TaxID=1974830 RepID=A0A2M7M199_9BACT|nr:MAG: hypothetical protein COZ39_00110 [Candidatus Roizmanbacteria bacterium CG_4_10_14_3_um_filter_33_21]
MLFSKEGSRRVCPKTAELLRNEVREIMKENHGKLPRELVESLRVWARFDAKLHQPGLVSYLAATRLDVQAWE